MSLIKMPSQLEINNALSALIYGQPGSGKTTLACSAPNAVLFDFDGGVNRINGAHQIPTVQVHSWEEAVQALNEVKASNDFQTIVDKIKNDLKKLNSLEDKTAIEKIVDLIKDEVASNE